MFCISTAAVLEAAVTCVKQMTFYTMSQIRSLAGFFP